MMIWCWKTRWSPWFIQTYFSVVRVELVFRGLIKTKRYRLLARVCAWTVCLIKTVRRCSLCGVLLLRKVYRIYSITIHSITTVRDTFCNTKNNEWVFMQPSYRLHWAWKTYWWWMTQMTVSPEKVFEIQTLSVWVEARYLSVSEVPHMTFLNRYKWAEDNNFVIATCIATFAYNYVDCSNKTTHIIYPYHIWKKRILGKIVRYVSILFNPYSAGNNFRRQNLPHTVTSVDVRF